MKMKWQPMKHVNNLITNVHTFHDLHLKNMQWAVLGAGNFIKLPAAHLPAYGAQFAYGARFTNSARLHLVLASGICSTRSVKVASH